MKTKLLTICLLYVVPSLFIIQPIKADSYMERPLMPSYQSKKDWVKFGRLINNDTITHYFPKRIEINRDGNYLVWVLYNFHETKRSNVYLYEIDCRKNMRFRKIFSVTHPNLWLKGEHDSVFNFDFHDRGINKKHWEENIIGLHGFTEGSLYYKSFSNLYSIVCNK